MDFNSKKYRTRNGLSLTSHRVKIIFNDRGNIRALLNGVKKLRMDNDNNVGVVLKIKKYGI